MNTDWDQKLDFLRAIRSGWCNSDYIEFLVQKVWRIDRPVDMVDFGCGFGYMGLLLMPMLPPGSTYTGIDISEVLLNEARRTFEGSPFPAEFVQADLNEVTPRQDYDIAVTQAVLRHMPNPKDILAKMVGSVRTDGWVICMETDRLLQDAGRYMSGMDYAGLDQTSLYRKLWKRELDRGGRDFRTGVKIPRYMQELGLRDIGVRINDCVKFANPHAGDYEAVFASMAGANGWDREWGGEEKERFIAAMMEKGLNEAEARQFAQNETLIRRNVEAGYRKDYILEMPCTPISFGRK